MTEMETVRNKEEVGQNQKAEEQERYEDEASGVCQWSCPPEQLWDGVPKL